MNALTSFSARLEAELAARQQAAPVIAESNIIKAKAGMYIMPNGNAGKTMSAIVLDYRYVNTYYPGTYDQNNTSPPVCWAFGIGANDQLEPSAKVKSPQNDSCKSCPMNQWGSGGGNRKACKNGIRLALVPEDEVDSGNIWLFNVSATGIKNWNKYLNILLGEQMLPINVVTKFTMDPNASYDSTPQFTKLKPTPDIERVSNAYNSAQALLDREFKVD